MVNLRHETDAEKTGYNVKRCCVQACELVRPHVGLCWLGKTMYM